MNIQNIGIVLLVIMFFGCTSDPELREDYDKVSKALIYQIELNESLKVLNSGQERLIKALQLKTSAQFEYIKTIDSFVDAKFPELNLLQKHSK